MGEPQIDNDLIDETVLALMFLTLHGQGGPESMARAWKSFDWNAMGRLHAKNIILDPVGKAKSVALTEEGRKRSEAAFYRLFVRKDGFSASSEVPKDLMDAITAGHMTFDYQWASDVNFDGIRLEVLGGDGTVLFDLSVHEDGALTLNTFSPEVPVDAVLSAIELARSR